MVFLRLAVGNMGIVWLLPVIRPILLEPIKFAFGRHIGYRPIVWMAGEQESLTRSVVCSSLFWNWSARDSQSV